MAAILLDNVVKAFPGGVTAVADFSLEVADGERVVIVGPSGCGKSTTLRLIAGLEVPTRGTIRFDGSPVHRTPPHRRDVAMVFQHPALYPHLDVSGNLAFGLKLRRVPRAEIKRRVLQVAELLGIAHLLTRQGSELSGGERQRVALGRAIARRPKAFLLDEPLASLDARLRDQLRLEIRRLHARLGTTTIYVTHDQAEAMTLAQRLVVLREGRIQQVADPQTVYERPANRFVATLIGSPPMNLVDGRIESAGSGPVFCCGDWTVPLPATWHGVVQAHPNKRITLGIRAEHVGLTAGIGVAELARTQMTGIGVAEFAGTQMTANKGKAVAAVTGVVEAVETLGADTYVYITADGNSLVCRGDSGASCRVGDRVTAALDTGHLHLFDAQSGRAFERPPE